MGIPIEFQALEKQLQNKKVFLVNVPDHNNVGDQLIWFGEELFLQKIHCTIRGIVSRNVLDTEAVSDEDVILLHGGGNFGDLYPEHQLFREKTIAQFPKNKIIMFPQTSYFQEDNALQRAIDIFSQHTDLTLCARDTHTYTFFCENFQKNTILLVPDMAMLLHREDVYQYIGSVKVEKEVLFLLRTDDEIKKTYLHADTGDRDVCDWGTIENEKRLDFFSRLYYRIRDSKNTLFLTKALQNIIIQKLLKMLQKFYVEKGVQALEKYTTIVTDRLHGALLGLILEKKVILLDNSYGKNKLYYDTWLTDNKNISSAQSLSEALEILHIQDT